jgi:ferrous iron transport protein B
MTIGLIGNPNVGKTSLFNCLTGASEKVGNYPGITVDKRSGYLKNSTKKIELIDFPGIYSLYPSSIDEKLVYDILTNQEDKDNKLDLIVLVTDYQTLKRGLFLFEQIQNLEIPILLAINKSDQIHLEKEFQSQFKLIFERNYHSKVVFVSSKKENFNKDLTQFIENGNFITTKSTFEFPTLYTYLKNELNEINPKNCYQLWLELSQNSISNDFLNNIKNKYQLVSKRLQVSETITRYHQIDSILKETNYQNQQQKKKFSNSLDSVLLHPFFGYIIFFGLMFGIFQLLFSVANYPMMVIENLFSFISLTLKTYLPKGILFSLFTDGIISGLAGIFVFLPQIILLYFFILLMEQSGYMSRVVFLMDRLMKPFGLNGKSVVPLISGVACAIPAIMSARNIENPKDRLITILVTPFMTCAARLPVYSVLIALVIPKTYYLGFNLQGLILMLMYILGIFTALLAGFMLKKRILTKQNSFLIIEIPTYKLPNFRIIGIDLWNKCLDFILGAGKIILAVSVILWFLSSFHPTLKNNQEKNIENSCLGIIGKAIEPVVKPLGYDWKISISLVSSIAAREVFVGTMKIIYNLEDTSLQENELKFTNFSDFISKFTQNIFNFDDDETSSSLINQMKKDTFIGTNKPVYTLASGLSLMIFYAFAMQCVSTIAIVKQETNSWKWTLIQFLGMTGIAYFSALIIYQLLK